jgi:murein biosynthesis integral membrane protein MurJ
VQAATLVTAIVLVVKGLGFVEKVLLAYFFGTGIEVDAYLVAYTLPFSAFVVLREVVKPAFLPAFLRTRRGSEADGRRLLGVVGTVLILLLAIATVAGMILADPLISMAAPGFAGEQRALAVRLTRIVVPAFLFLGLSTLTTAVLHADKRFALPAVGEAVFRAAPVALLLAAAGSIYAVAIGVLIGAAGKLGLEAGGQWRTLRRLTPSLDVRAPVVRQVGRLAAPLAGALFLSLFLAPLVENAFASRIGVGGVSALAYARKIVETLTTLLPYTLGLVLLPFSAEMAAGRDTAALARTLSGAVRALCLLFVPVAVGLIMLRVPFVRLLFERGAFGAASTALTAEPLLFYGLALLPFALEVVVIQFFFARQDTLTPVLADVAAFALNVALLLLLTPVLGLGGIALAAAVAKAAKVLALLVLFARRVPAFRLAPLGVFGARLLMAALAAAAVLWAAEPVLVRLGREGGLVRLSGQLVAGAVLGGGTFYLVAYLAGIDDLRQAGRLARAWVRDRLG